MPTPPSPASIESTVTTRYDLESSTVVACQVCREDVALTDTMALRACGHRFCGDCITGFLNAKIHDGDVEIKCFYENAQHTCRAAIEVADVEALVSPETVAKYHWFVLVKANAQARRCPFCEHTQVPIATADEPQCVCDRCGKAFCITHGNAHTELETCAQYEARQSRAEKRSRQRVKTISRPCPGCARPIERNGGCSHMTCPVCKAHFCWYCGTAWGFDHSVHYSVLSLDSCDGTAEARIPFMDTSWTCGKRLLDAAYLVLIATVGWPLTLVLCWAWIPYAVWKEECAIARRACVLARFFTILVMGFTVVFFALLVVLVDEGSEWILENGGRGLKKLGEFFRNCCSLTKCKCRPTEKSDGTTPFTTCHDPVLVV